MNKYEMTSFVVDTLNRRVWTTDSEHDIFYCGWDATKNATCRKIANFAT